MNHNLLKFLSKENKFQDDFSEYFDCQSKLNRQELFNNLINNPENEFEEIINILFQYLFPISLCENLFLKQRFEKKHSNIITGTQIINDDEFKKYAAYSVNDGSKLYIVQHGGAYEYLRFNSFEQREKKISNFISWNKKFNLSATKFFDRKIKFNNNNDNIIFFCTKLYI